MAKIHKREEIIIEVITFSPFTWNNYCKVFGLLNLMLSSVRGGCVDEGRCGLLIPPIPPGGSIGLNNQTTSWFLLSFLFSNGLLNILQIFVLWPPGHPNWPTVPWTDRSDSQKVSLQLKVFFFIFFIHPVFSIS